MNIILGVTGSVAATLTHKMAKALQAFGEVRIVATQAGTYFIDNNLLFRDCQISKVWVDRDEWWDDRHQKIWEHKGDPVPHIDFRKWADILVVAPLTANTLAKMAYGICDNMLTSIYRAWDTSKPVVCAPAMNTLMWQHESTREHLTRLRDRKVWFVGPVTKELACGDEGPGAMADISDIALCVAQLLATNRETP